MKITLHQDWIRARVLPEEKILQSGIVLIGAQPIRKAVVLDIGPGKLSKKGILLPVQLGVGDTFAFFKATSETKQGHALALLLEQDEVLIREPDVLFVYEGKVSVDL